MYIYCITNIISNKQYVGLTTRAIDESKNYYGSGVYIMRAIKKHGKHNFKKEILELCDTDINLKKREIFWIKEMNTKSPNGYNLTAGGDGLLRPAPSVILKLKNKIVSAETRLKMRNAQLGIPMTKEAKEKLINSITGRKLSKETCKKMSEYHIGKPLSKKTIKKIRENQPTCKSILQIDKITNKIINEYHSIQEASRKTNIAASGICKCCKGELKTAGKFIWKYKELL